MSPIAVLFGLILLATSVIFIANPLLQSGQRNKATVFTTAKEKTHSQDNYRQAVILALRDLDFDFKSGKVTEDDYQPLRSALLTEAAHLMQDQERQKEDKLEALIQSRHKTKGSRSQQDVCPHCRSSLPVGAKFCSNCGNPVVETVCPGCGKKLQSGDRYCPGCGNAVVIQ